MMKPRFKTHEEITDHYVSTGQLTKEDVNDMETRHEEILSLMRQARENVKRRRGWLVHLVIVLQTEFPFPRLGYRHPEEEAEYKRLETELEVSANK